MNEVNVSTKRLSRTVIEGGRRNVWERRISTQEERAEVRAYVTRCEYDPDYFDEEVVPERTVVYKEFSDKLNPMERWLSKQVGRVWNDVRSEVFEKFDTRTTAGRHITFDHLLREVVDTESGFDKYGHMMNPNIDVVDQRKKKGYSRGGFTEYYVDENGILCVSEDRNHRRRHTFRRRRREPYATVEQCAEAAKWLNYRIIGTKDGKLCWFAPTEGVWKAEWIKSDYGYGTELKYYLWDYGEYKARRNIKTDWGNYETVQNRSGKHWEEIDVPFSYRQSAALNSAELKYFNELNPRLKRNILSYGKGR